MAYVSGQDEEEDVGYCSMAAGGARVKDSSGNIPVGDESSESEGETEPAKSFHRRLSTNRDIKCSVCHC